MLVFKSDMSLRMSANLSFICCFCLQWLYICETLPLCLAVDLTSPCEVHKKDSVVLVRKRTIPIERSPPVSEASANFSG
jgi:hypothetical protein